jgi:hypothetical protein
MIAFPPHKTKKTKKKKQKDQKDIKKIKKHIQKVTTSKKLKLTLRVKPKMAVVMVTTKLRVEF